MKPLHLIAAFMAILILSLPVCFADELRLQYDANGNVVYDGQYYREYNGLNQLYRIRNGSNTSSPLYQEYSYHPLEERVLEKRVYLMNGSLKERVIYFDRDYVRIINSSGTYDYEYIYAEGQLMAQVNPDGSTYYMETDIKGDVLAVMNSSGAVIENTSYSSYGEVLSGGKATRFGYEAQEHDSVLGDTDFHARIYSPSLGIFLQPDSVLPNIYDPQQLNRYMFERGNPLKNEDKTGHIVELIVLVVEIAIIILNIGLIIGLIHYYSTGGKYSDINKGIDTNTGLTESEDYPSTIGLRASKKQDSISNVQKPQRPSNSQINACKCEAQKNKFTDGLSNIHNSKSIKPEALNPVVYSNLETGNKLYWYGDSNGPKTDGYKKQSETSTSK